MRRALALVLALVLIGLAACQGTPSPRRPELLIFAAASLRDVLSEVGAAFEAATGVATFYNFAGSNVLAQQVAATPRGDVFISANRQWLDEVTRGGHVDEATRRPMLSNALSLVAGRDSQLTVDHLADLATLPFEHLALGDPTAVPAGIYARAALENVRLTDGGSLWSRVAERILPAPDVRAAAALAAAHAGTLAIVYRTDARAMRGVRTLLTLPASSTPRIRYEAAVLRASARPEAAKRFVDYLTSADAQQVFVTHGFLPWSPASPAEP